MKCYGEFSDADSVFCPDRGYLCSSCSNQEHVVICLDCGEHFSFYSMKQIEGRALCERDYNREIEERELNVQKTKIDVGAINTDEKDTGTVDSFRFDEEAESRREAEETKKNAMYEEIIAYRESDIPWVLEKEGHGETSALDGEGSHLISEGRFGHHSHHLHRGCRGHHPVSFY